MLLVINGYKRMNITDRIGTLYIKMRVSSRFWTGQPCPGMCISVAAVRDALEPKPKHGKKQLTMIPGLLLQILGLQAVCMTRSQPTNMIDTNKTGALYMYNP